MKIKRRDLVHLIREMAMDEMAYMGMPNIQKGTKLSPGGAQLSRDTPTRDIEKIGRFFKSKNWNKNADKFYTRAFPNSNVWVIPQIGSKDSEELQFDKEESGYTIPDFTYPQPTGRGVFYSISEKLLRSLGMPEEEIAGVDFANDIIFVPRVGRPTIHPSKLNSPSKVGARSFSMPTPHMLIHALFDDGILSLLPEVERARIIFDGEDPYNKPVPAKKVLPGGDIEYVIPGIEPEKSFIGMKAPITAALRGSAIADETDELANEVFAGVLLYRGLERIVVAPELEKWVYEKTGMGVKELINSAIEACRAHLKGKIVAVEVY